MQNIVEANSLRALIAKTIADQLNNDIQHHYVEFWSIGSLLYMRVGQQHFRVEFLPEMVTFGYAWRMSNIKTYYYSDPAFPLNLMDAMKSMVR